MRGVFIINNKNNILVVIIITLSVLLYFSLYKNIFADTGNEIDYAQNVIDLLDISTVVEDTAEMGTYITQYVSGDIGADEFNTNLQRILNHNIIDTILNTNKSDGYTLNINAWDEQSRAILQKINNNEPVSIDELNYILNVANVEQENMDFTYSALCDKFGQACIDDIAGHTVVGSLSTSLIVDGVYHIGEPNPNYPLNPNVYNYFVTGSFRVYRVNNYDYSTIWSFNNESDMYYYYPYKFIVPKQDFVKVYPLDTNVDNNINPTYVKNIYNTDGTTNYDNIYNYILDTYIPDIYVPTDPDAPTDPTDLDVPDAPTDPTDLDVPDDPTDPTDAPTDPTDAPTTDLTFNDDNILVQFIKNVFKWAFVPSDDYFVNKFNNFKINLFSSVELDTNTLNQLQNIQESDLTDIKINYNNKEVTAVSFNTWSEIKPVVQPWIVGFTNLLLFMYSINQLYFLLRGTYIIGGSSKKGDE